MKYLTIGLLVCMLGVGCKMTPPSATTLSTNNNKVFYVIKSGTSKGGGPVGTVVASENPDGSFATLGAFTGRSNVEQIIDGLTGVGGSVGNGSLGGYFVGRGARQSGDSNTTNQNQFTNQSQIQVQGQKQ